MRNYKLQVHGMKGCAENYMFIDVSKVAVLRQFEKSVANNEKDDKL